mgnify:CR=1 FL=1|tara:strand:- start:2206 stop:2670 length:465 start_codon:yes stop_codon:yes gene_type:complete
MKKTILFAILLISIIGHSQEQINTNTINTSSFLESDWIVYVSSPKFKIEYKTSNCDPSKGFDFIGIIFKITNLTSKKINFYWEKELFYAGTCRTCGYTDEYSYNVSVAPNSSIEGDCENQSGFNLKIFLKFNDEIYSEGDALTSFKLSNLQLIQ